MSIGVWAGRVAVAEAEVARRQPSHPRLQVHFERTEFLFAQSPAGVQLHEIHSPVADIVVLLQTARDCARIGHNSRVKSTYIRAISQRRVEIIAVPNRSRARPFLMVQIVERAKRLVVASELFGVRVSVAVIVARPGRIQVDFVVDVSLDEVRQLRVAFFRLAIAVPHVATQTPNQILCAISECSEPCLE